MKSLGMTIDFYEHCKYEVFVLACQTLDRLMWGEVEHTATPLGVEL